MTTELDNAIKEYPVFAETVRAFEVFNRYRTSAQFAVYSFPLTIRCRQTKGSPAKLLSLTSSGVVPT